MLSIEQVTDLAEDIFYEVAEENLSESLLDLFEAQSQEVGFVETSTPTTEIWQEKMQFTPDPEEFAEVIIGLNTAEAKLVYARILISTDEDDKTCHILWPEKD